MIIIVIALLTFVLLITIASLRIPRLGFTIGASQSEKINIIDTWLTNLNKQEKFNGAVLLAKNNEIILSKGYGLININNSDIVCEHSSFNLASVSKHFTAMGVVILKSKSLLSYDDALSKHIPELAFYSGVTIRNLLHHTSGIPDYMRLVLQKGNNLELVTVSDIISLYQKHEPRLHFNPGEKFEYSNTGYVLLAEIIKRVSGITFSQFMKENIFEPLNMKDTQIFNLLSDEPPHKRVYGYGHKLGILGGSKRTKDLNHFDGVAGDGGVYSSAHDLFIWHQALNSGTLVSNELYEEAYQPARLTDGTKTRYGFGWFVNSNHTVEHAGGWQGFASYIYRDLSNQDLVVILDNSSNVLRVNSIGFRFNSIGLNLIKAIKNI